eukprot:c22703_g1_i1 orf=316-1335(-)
MASQLSGPQLATGDSKKRHAKYFHHASKRRKEVDLTAGVQGFLITCDGGRERQATREVVNLLDEYYTKLLTRKGSTDEEVKCGDFQRGVSPSSVKCPDSSENDHQISSHPAETDHSGNPDQLNAELHDGEDNPEKASSVTPPSIGEGDRGGTGTRVNSIDDMLEEEMSQLRDTKKTLFAGLETGCAGVVFIRMLTETGMLSPNELVEAIMHDASTLRKPLTRFCLKLLPIEVTCYASADEVRKFAEPCIVRHFPQGEKAFKFAVVYEARANSSVNRMEMIDAVAKLVSKPHSVDLKKPDKTIIVQVVKTICVIGVVANFKEFLKYNLRQLAIQKGTVIP